MIDLHWLTSSPAALRTALVNRSIIKSDGAGGFVGVLPGLEMTWGTVPTPIITSLGPPPVMDTRKVFMMRLAHEADANDDDGSATQPDDPSPRYSRSKLVQYVKNNSTPETITGADGTKYRTFKLSASIWVVRPQDAAAFGNWQ